MIPCHSHPTALHGWIKNKCNQIRYGESQGHIANGDSIRSSMCGGLSRTSFIHSIATCFDHPYHLIFASILKQYRVHRRIITDNRRIKISWLLLSQSDSIYRLCRPIPSYLLSGNMILEAALCRIVAYRRFSFRSSNIFLLIMSCSSGDSWCCTWWFNRE